MNHQLDLSVHEFFLGLSHHPWFQAGGPIGAISVCAILCPRPLLSFLKAVFFFW